MINVSGLPAVPEGNTVPVLGPAHARPARPRMSAARAAVLRELTAAGGAVTVTALADQLGQHPNTVREHLDGLARVGRVERLRSQPSGRGRPAWLYRTVRPSVPDGAGTDDAPEEGPEYAALALALIDQVVSTNPDPRDMARQAGERWGRTLVRQRSAPGSAPERPGTGSAGTAGTASAAGTAGVTSAAGTAGTGKDAGTAGAAGGASAAGPAGAAATVVDMLADLRFEPQPGAGPGDVRLTACPLLDAARRNPDVVCEVHLGIVRGALDSLGGDPDGAVLEAFAEPGACRLHLPAE